MDIDRFLARFGFGIARNLSTWILDGERCIQKTALTCSHHRVPIPLGVNLKWCDWPVKRMHRDGDSSQNERSQVPGDNGGGQGNDISDATRKVAKQEEIADKAADQRSQIEPVCPVGIVEWSAVQFTDDASTSVTYVHPPRCDQGGNRDDVGQWSDCRCQEWNSSRGKPPISFSVVVETSHLESPPFPYVYRVSRSSFMLEVRFLEGNGSIGSGPGMAV